MGNANDKTCYQEGLDAKRVSSGGTFRGNRNTIRYHDKILFLIIPLLIIIITFSSCYQPDKDTVKRLVWKVEMQEKMDTLVKSQYNQTKENCQAYFESEKEKQEDNPLMQSILSSDNIWSEAIRDRLDSTYQTKTDSILEEVDIYNDRITRWRN